MLGGIYMALNKDIKKVLVLGSGPIVIGQSAEFDYSGAQACLAIKEEGIKTVLVNSNPATIMTDKEIADKVYIEPLTLDYLEKIIIKERPDSILCSVGGQTALNLAIELDEANILEKYNIKVLGTSILSIKKGEDRQLFKELMQKINEPLVESKTVSTLEEGLDFATKIGYPLIVRPAYTLGGSGGGICDTKEELIEILETGLRLSPVNQVLLERSIKGYKEVEYEVLRDSKGNFITVCNMENIDPVGVHTGDSIVVAPSLTLSDKEYQLLRTSSKNILEAVGVEGGCNVQFALDPHSFEYRVIEINPRVSRSSALASKATGYPIAKVATKIALGYTLDEIKNSVTKKTTAAFEPSLDYVVVKIPKWPFDKFLDANKYLGTKMMATGEVMAIAKNFEAALLKALRSLEINRFTLTGELSKEKDMTIEQLKERIQVPDDNRLFYLSEIIRRMYLSETINKITGIDKFFIEKIRWIVQNEENLKHLNLCDLTKDYLLELKEKGFSDSGIAKLMNISPKKIYELRKLYDIFPSYKVVDTCAGEFEAVSPYYYSSYNDFDEVEVSNKDKVIVIGSGPIRIGQGIEFDYCCVHAVKSLTKNNIETIIINNNPETVSTDFDISDKLYFEPLTKEDVLNIINKEKPMGVIVAFGGQTAIKLASFLDENNINILGTSYSSINKAEDRDEFEKVLEKLDIKRPKGINIYNVQKGLELAQTLKYPLLVRPSYVIGGQGMEIVNTKEELEKYLTDSFKRDPKNSVLIDKYLLGTEIEVDAICDKDNKLLIPGIMEHLERAGVHSGDSITIYPSISLTKEDKSKIFDITKKIANELKVVGMINIQFIKHDDEIYVIEVNPRASRTVPYISKVSKVGIIDIATNTMLGKTLKELGYKEGIYEEPNYYATKIPVFSTEKLKDVEVSLGPQMRSTGEVLGVSNTYLSSLMKGFIGANTELIKDNKKILATINDDSKEEFLDIVKNLKGKISFVATNKTAKLLKSQGFDCEEVSKISIDDESILDIIRKKEVSHVINIKTKGNDSNRDGFKIRRCAIESGVSILTSLDTFKSLIDIYNSDESIANSTVYNLA